MHSGASSRYRAEDTQKGRKGCGRDGERRLACIHSPRLRTGISKAPVAPLLLSTTPALCEIWLSSGHGESCAARRPEGAVSSQASSELSFVRAVVLQNIVLDGPLLLHMAVRRYCLDCFAESPLLTNSIRVSRARERLLFPTHVCWVSQRSRHVLFRLWISRSVWSARVSVNSTSQKALPPRSSQRRRGRPGDQQRLGVLCLVQPSHNRAQCSTLFRCESPIIPRAGRGPSRNSSS
jgi:hypothetical protein